MVNLVHKFNVKKANVKKSLTLIQRLAQKGNETAALLLYGLSQLLAPVKLEIGVEEDIELFKHYCYLVEKLQQLPAS